MHMPTPRRVRASYSIPLLIRRTLLLFLTLSMLAGAVTAQTEQETKLAAAEKLLTEGLEVIPKPVDN